MSTKIEIHLLQSFPPANLNRDDTNTPKDCEFGGVRRARISSQCFKRAVRLHPDFSLLTGVAPADRTRRLAGSIQDRLAAANKPEDEAAMVARAFTEVLLGGLDEKDPEKSKVLFYISLHEKETIVSLLTADWEAALKDSKTVGEKKDKKKSKGDVKPFANLIKDFHKQFSNRTSAPDVAMFGRMLAEDPELNLDAACQVAHAISTHAVNMETDFFTAVDDLQPDSTAGSAMMSLTSFNSATYYRYAVIDWAQLVKNLDGDQSLALKTVRAFLRASVKAIPTGKQNSFAAQTPPGFVLAVVRDDGQAWSLANAFEKPLMARNGSGFLDGSARAMVHQWQRLNRVYGNPELPAQVFALAVDETLPIEPLESEDSLFDLESKVVAAITEA